MFRGQGMQSFHDRRRVEDALNAIASRCASVEAAYLFGSVARNEAGPLSDVDVAILTEPAQADQTAGCVQDELCRALKTDRVELVLLHNAPPPLAYRVIRDGRCVFCRDRRAKEAFETRTVMRYLDFKPLRDQAFRTSRDHILRSA